MDRSKELPRGFYDHTGEMAEKMRMVVNNFYRCGKLYGFEWMDLSLVGYQETFLVFGSAAQNRGYPFTDSGGRKLMLCADSLAASLRVYRKKLDKPGINVMRLMGRVQVFRHRKREYRNWSHLVLSAFNEDNALIISLVLINFANDFLTHYYSHIKYTFYFYGIYEKVFEACEVSHGEGFTALYEIYGLGERNVDRLSHKLVTNIERICADEENSRAALTSLKDRFPFLEETITEYEVYLDLLDRIGLDYSISWTDFSAIEYSSGICFIATDAESGIQIADGGAYDYIVNQLDDRIKNCYSFACALERIASRPIHVEHDDKYYLIKLDCSDYFFALVCSYLRKQGMSVMEVIANKKLSRVIASLPPDSNYAVIGQREEQSGEVIVAGQAIVIHGD